MMSVHTLVTVAASSVPDRRVFSLDMQTLLSTAVHMVNFLILAAAITYLLYKPVRQYLQNRNEMIEQQFSSARSDLVEAEAARLRYEQSLKDLEIEKGEILYRAHKLAEEESEQIIADAKTEADAIRESAAKEVEYLAERARDQAKLIILEVSTAMAGKLIGATIDQEIHDRLFTEAVDELESILWEI